MRLSHRQLAGLRGTVLSEERGATLSFHFDVRIVAVYDAIFDLRYQLRTWPTADGGEASRDRIGMLHRTLQHLIAETRAAALDTHTAIVVRVLEQAAPLFRAGYIPERMLQVVYEWLELLLSSLADPTNAQHAATLVRHLGDTRWERPACRAERENMLSGLLMEALGNEI